MKLLKPVIWIDQKIQSIVDSVAHFFLRNFEIKLSSQRYTVMTLAIITLVGSYFEFSEKERSAVIFAILLLYAIGLIFLQRQWQRMDEWREQNGIRIDSKKFFVLYFVKGYFLSLIIRSMFDSNTHFMSSTNAAAWLIHIYLLSTPTSSPPIEKHKQVPSFSF